MSAAFALLRGLWAVKPVRYVLCALAAIAVLAGLWRAALAAAHYKFEALRAEGARQCRNDWDAARRQSDLDSRYVGDRAGRESSATETRIVYRDRWLTKETEHAKAAIDEAGDDEARWNAWRDSLIRLRDGAAAADGGARENPGAAIGADDLRDRDSPGVG
jgi:hypothetical protein